MAMPQPSEDMRTKMQSMMGCASLNAPKASQRSNDWFDRCLPLSWDHNANVERSIDPFGLWSDTAEACATCITA